MMSLSLKDASLLKFAAAGKAMDTGGARAHTMDEVQAALRQAWDSSGPFVVDILSSDQSDCSVFFDAFEEESAARKGAYGLG